MPSAAATSSSKPVAGGLERLRSFPRAPAPNDNAKAVKSDLPEEHVVHCQNILAYHIAHHPGSKVFGNGQAMGLKLVEMAIRDRRQEPAPGENRPQKAPKADLEGMTICELAVEEDMLNVHGTLAGACAVLIIDLATFAPLFALSAVTGVDASGFSTTMNIVWHAPAMRGMTLRFVGTTLSSKGRTLSARCEVYDKRTGALLISATHVIAPVHGLPVGRVPDRAKL
ncbi:hypothetical protein C8Q76DRAFT_299151 [Earliella scabrosa]|nr:hypothetical protein C8Q76DRAFT_299151 [Earliella scabrosa]